MIVYVETSAAAKLLVQETSSEELAARLDSWARGGDELISASLVETELRRLAVRLDLPQTDVTEILDRFDVVELDRSMYREAGLLPGRHLRSLDALHLAVALRIGADVLVSYDQRQAEAARGAGVRVHSP